MASRRIVIAPDKFRGTATAAELATTLAATATALGWDATPLPLSDGGEGFLDAFGGASRFTDVTGPDGSPVRAEWRIVGRTAVIESARACGLQLAGGAERNDPVAATTRGVGELLIAARDAGVDYIVVGCGGSATTDGGVGLVDAVVAAGGLSGARLRAATDVRAGFFDAARVFGPQKGADAATIVVLEQRLRAVAERYRTELGVDVTDVPGTGAAGGLAGGIVALGGTIVGGFDTVADAVGLDTALADADVVVTGEGRLDATSWSGKVVGEVVARSRPGARVIVIVGEVAEGTTTRGAVEVLSLSELFGMDRALEDTLACAAEALTQALAGYSA